MTLPTLGNDLLALIGGTLLIIVGFTVARRKRGKIDVIYVGAGAILLAIGVSRII